MPHVIQHRDISPTRVRFQSERCPLSIGTGVRFQSEQVSAFNRNTQLGHFQREPT